MNQNENQPVTNISIGYPEVGELQLFLGVGACKINIVPADVETFISGRYDDPAGALPLQITQEGGAVRITQLQNFSNFFNLFNKTPTLELALGKARPFALTIETGASDSHLELGGLPLMRLMVRQGASKSEIDFSAPNPQVMTALVISGGAGSFEARNLANANFDELKVEGGAGSYKLDFGGTLQHNGHVRVPAGMSAIEIHIPATTPAVITTEVVLGGVDVTGDFTRKDGKYWTPPALTQQMPALGIDASVALGSIHLFTT